MGISLSLFNFDFLILTLQNDTTNRNSNNIVLGSFGK